MSLSKIYNSAKNNKYINNSYKEKHLLKHVKE